jgi:tetratricopeptide (TPR) repeat protein
MIMLIYSFAFAQDRGMKPVEMTIEGKNTVLYKESHALLIGVSAYNAGLTPLPGVAGDIEKVQAAIENNGFDVVTVMNPDALGLQQAFTSFIAHYGQGADNRLLFYFAGHGYTEKMPYGENIGYICPVDSPNPNVDPSTFQTKAMPMGQIEIFAKQIRSKHALFIFDACFSGSIFSASRAVPEIINYKTTQPVRQFISSGSADETVPDVSIFQSQFVRALSGEADVNNDGFITGTELGEFLQSTVVNYSYGSQHPQYGKIRNPNLDKGDFVFILADNISGNNVPLEKKETPTPPVNEERLSSGSALATTLKEARASASNKDYTSAKEKYLEAYQLDPENTEILSELALCYARLKDYPNAIKYYNIKIGLKNVTAQDYYNLGKVYYNMKDYLSAESCLTKAEKLTPEYIPCVLWLARTRSNLDPDGLEGLARPSFERLIDLAKEDPGKYEAELSEANYYLAWYFFSQFTKDKNKEDAAKSAGYCQQVISINPGNENASKANEILSSLQRSGYLKK